MELDQMGDMIKNTLWRNSEGFFENVLRLFSYAIPFVPGLNFSIYIIEAIADSFGYGLSSLGKYLDKLFPVDPGTTAEELEAMAPQMSQKLMGELKTASQSWDDDQIRKVAFLGGMFKLIKYVPKVIGYLIKAAKWFMLAAGVTTVGNLYSAVTGEGKGDGKGGLMEMIPGMSMVPGIGGMGGMDMGGKPFGLITQMMQGGVAGVVGGGDPELNPDNYGPQGYKGQKA